MAQTSIGDAPPRERSHRLRSALLALLLLGASGLFAELLLLEHHETRAQWLPLVALAAGILSGGAVCLRPAKATLRTFQLVMLGYVVLGGVGTVLHFRGNLEFERELYPTRQGRELVWGALKGATPALAPGALAQLGLLGLVFTYRHPGITDPGPNGPRSARKAKESWS